jgi:hypothetical protein
MLTLFAACAEPDADSALQIQTLPRIAQLGSAESNLANGPDGTVIMSWLEPDGDDTALRFSTLDKGQWSAVGTVAKGNNWFVNWADFPSVVPIDETLWAAHWLVKRSGGTYEYDVAVALSTDGGQSWGDSVLPHTDGIAAEHGFASLYPWKGGVGALWLDGRNMPDGGGMTLRSAVLSKDSAITDSQLADELVCDCCQTDVALGPLGPIAVYRNRTTDEIRDIYVMRSINGQWEEGKPVADDNWHIAGCPVNGPAIAASGEDVVVAWFTGAGNIPKVRFARSTDGAESFEDAIDLVVYRPLGRVGIVLLAGGDALVSWLQNGSDGKADILVRRVSVEGKLSDAFIVASTSAGRLSGFPQMVDSGDDIVFSWTDTTGDETIVESALVGAID